MNTELTNERLIAVWDPYASESDDPNEAYDEAQFAWKCATGNIGAFLKRKGWDVFYVEGTHMGWRNLSGYRTVDTNEGEAFVRQVTGLTCHMFWKLWDMGDHLHMTIWHHDSPTGEGRDIYPAETCAICGEILTPQDEVHHNEDGDTVCLYHWEQTTFRYELEEGRRHA